MKQTIRMLALSNIHTPFLALEPDIAVERYKLFRQAMPLIKINYAVKANPHPDILLNLVKEGSHFDVASVPEIKACLAAGALPAALVYGNTLKKPADIESAVNLGIKMFAADSFNECIKLARYAPGCTFYVRLEVPHGDAEWPLSRKFGCDVDTGAELLSFGMSMGLDPAGFSFHVGSQQMNTQAYKKAISIAGNAIRKAAEKGVGVRLLNIGGGWPVPYLKPVPGINEFAETINKEIAECIPEGVTIMAEPGRFIAAPCGIMASEVVEVAERNGNKWLYLDIGRFSGLAESEGESIRYRMECLSEGEDSPFIVAGPTCDGADILYEKNPVMLPGNISCGHRVLIHNAGAYTTVYASHSFNGMPGPSIVVPEILT